MVKFLSLLLIASAFAFGGRAYAAHKENKARIISDIIAMINSAENRLRYSNAPLSEVFDEACICGKLGFIRECISKTESGMGFHDAWYKSIEEDLRLKSLLGEFSGILTDFGMSLGVTDTEGQISECEYYKNIFSAELLKREEESHRCSRVFPQLGLLAGVFSLIFLI